jgi:hypothetical protein
MEWLLAGVPAASFWPASGSSSILFIQKQGSYYAVYPLSGEVRFSTATDTNSNGEPDSVATGNRITDSRTQVSGLTFTRGTLNGQATLRMQATLQGRYTTTTYDKTYYFR